MTRSVSQGHALRVLLSLPRPFAATLTNFTEVTINLFLSKGRGSAISQPNNAGAVRCCAISRSNIAGVGGAPCEKPKNECVRQQAVLKKPQKRYRKIENRLGSGREIKFDG